jgi:hypothetical protein
MKKLLPILIISFATLVLVANNVILQYVEKSCVVAFDNQDDDEESKSEKNDEVQKVKEFLTISFNSSFQYKNSYQKNVFIFFINKQLPFVSIDVELLPPNFV